jgi:hypothetical protein
MRLATLSRWRSAQRAHVVDQAAIGRGGLGYPMPRDQQIKVTRQRLRAKGEPLPARKKERAPRPFKKKLSLNQRFRHFLCWLDIILRLGIDRHLVDLAHLLASGNFGPTHIDSGSIEPVLDVRRIELLNHLHRSLAVFGDLSRLRSLSPS